MSDTGVFSLLLTGIFAVTTALAQMTLVYKFLSIFLFIHSSVLFVVFILESTLLLGNLELLHDKVN